jgi:hypothetical protein
LWARPRTLSRQFKVSARPHRCRAGSVELVHPAVKRARKPVTALPRDGSGCGHPFLFEPRARRNVNFDASWSVAPTNVSLGRAGVLCFASRMPAWPQAAAGSPQGMGLLLFERDSNLGDNAAGHAEPQAKSQLRRPQACLVIPSIFTAASLRSYGGQLSVSEIAKRKPPGHRLGQRSRASAASLLMLTHTGLAAPATFVATGNDGLTAPTGMPEITITGAISSPRIGLLCCRRLYHQP